MHTSSKNSGGGTSHIFNYRTMVNLSIVGLAVVTSLVQSVPSKKAILKVGSIGAHGIRLQPELDKIDIDLYLANKKALALQVQCVVFDGPCDWVGRWVKPRVPSALLGECLLCTEYQKSHMERIMSHIEQHFPEEFRLGVQKYLKLAGIEVPTSPVASESFPSPTTTEGSKIQENKTTTEIPIKRETNNS